MAFTYLGTLATDRDRVRFYTGDTSNAPDAGIKPGGYNFMDAEIDGLVTVEGSWQGAVAGIFEALASLFAQEVDTGSSGQKNSMLYSQRAARYQQLAKQWRSGNALVPTQAAVTRVDGFSDDVDAEET